jgi:hypothetical protein
LKPCIYDRSGLTALVKGLQAMKNLFTDDPLSADRTDIGEQWSGGSSQPLSLIALHFRALQGGLRLDQEDVQTVKRFFGLGLGSTRYL